MPIWDSLHRGLEKASHEAARIAKAQRLRSAIDGFTRQIDQQSDNLLASTMNLYLAGHLTQSELLPLCQEIASLQQQILQLQNELRQMQAGQAQPDAPPPPEMYTYSPSTYSGQYPSLAGDLPPTVLAPPPPEYQAYLDSTSPMTVPPPPPGMEAESSSLATIAANADVFPAALSSEQRLCQACHREVSSTNQFCPFCGASMQSDASAQAPTMRGSVATGAPIEQQETTYIAAPPGSPASANEAPDAPTPEEKNEV